MSFLVWDRAKIWRTGRHPQQEFRVYLNDCQNFLADPSRETLSFSGLWARAVWAKTQAKGAQVRLGEARWSLMARAFGRVAARGHADGRDGKQLPPKSGAFLVAFSLHRTSQQANLVYLKVY